jgi:DNA-binding MarR family transcriptional regulator
MGDNMEIKRNLTIPRFYLITVTIVWILLVSNNYTTGIGASEEISNLELKNGENEVDQNGESWSDNFDDNNLDNWTVSGLARNQSISSLNRYYVWEANTTVENGYLEALKSEVPENDGPVWNFLVHESSITHGTWSFDFKSSSERIDWIGFAYNQPYLNGSENVGDALIIPHDTQGYLLGLRHNIGSTIFSFLYFDNQRMDYITTQITTVKTEERWYHIDIVREESNRITLYLDGEELFSTTPKLDLELSSHFIMQITEGSCYDNISVSNEILIGFDEPNENEYVEFLLNPWVIGIGLLSIFGLIGGAYYVYNSSDQYLRRGKSLSKSLSSGTRSVISNVFGNYAKSFFIIGANMISKKTVDQEFEKVIPSELYSHKFLMHPVRLAMSSILLNETKLQTTKLREKLGISWSDLSSHTRAMESKGYIYIENILVDDKFVQVISLESRGIREYEELTSLLFEVVDQSALLQRYVNDAIKIKSEDLN